MIWFFEVRFEDMSRDVLLLISGAEGQRGDLTCVYTLSRHSLVTPALYEDTASSCGGVVQLDMFSQVVSCSSSLRPESAEGTKARMSSARAETGSEQVVDLRH
jgi:hypothetical protein